MGEIKLLAKALRQLTAVPARVSKPFAAYVTTELKNGILAGRDPYGNALKANAPATVRKKGHGRVLQDSLTLLGQVKAIPLAGSGVGIDGGPWYGAINLPVRPYLPIFGMPARWRAELKRLVGETVRKTLKGRS